MSRLKDSSEPESLWKALAAERPPRPALQGCIDADVAIIGGGYSGLSAAHACIERGAKPVVLEAHHIGWGASGRNGGVVSAKFRMLYSAIARRYGMDHARRMYHLSHEALDLVEHVVDRHGLQDARFHRGGHLQCAHSEQALSAITAEMHWRKKNLGDDSVAEYTRDEVAQETGAQVFAGGVLIRDGATVQPLHYIHGLAMALEKCAPEVLHENTAVVSIQADPRGVKLQTEAGTVLAREVIIATNGYSGLSRATRTVGRYLVPFRSAIIATEKLPKCIDEQLLLDQRSYLETRRMMRWFRKVDGRIIFGGRGAFGQKDSQSAFDALRRAMVAIFPQLSDVRIDYQWSGHVAMTLDKFPHVGRIGDRLTCCLGYNGAGIAMSTLMGSYAARIALGEKIDLPMLGSETLRPIPLYPLRQLAIRSVAGWYQLLDAVGV